MPLAIDLKAPLTSVRLRSSTRHPHVFRKRIDAIDGSPQVGDWVAVYDCDDRIIGHGLFNPRSEIAVRIVRFGPELPDEAYWSGILDRAVGLRRDMLSLDGQTDAYRVIHAEADGVPGVVIDRYGDVLSAEVFAYAMARHVDELLDGLQTRLGTKHRVVRGSPAIVSQEGWDIPQRTSPGTPPQANITEFGTRFRIKFAGGHKTGFFCDQRENRQKLASYCRGKSVLDLCCYSGGFSIQAKRLGQAAEVIGVDLDEEPLAVARENANLNQVRVKFVQADAFAYMRDMLANGRQFDVIVLDPPKLIRNREEIEEGTRKHLDLNRLAMQLVAPGGLLLSCTCAGLLPLVEFEKLLHYSARISGPVVEPATATTPERRGPRDMQILAKTGAAQDHPISSRCPETEYLQAVWMRMG
jgi:23S rRNA (cytosine1962-C5)-methyltransferase